LKGSGKLKLKKGLINSDILAGENRII